MTNVLFNPYSDNSAGKQHAEKLSEILSGEELKFADITEISNICDYISQLPAEDKIVISGGDGTIHYLINQFNGKIPNRTLYYFASGCGNDFKKDVPATEDEPLIKINQYINNLPSVSIDGGKSMFFFNGIGFGIDGFCCEEADKIKKQSTKPVNYAAIAIKGILGAFSTRNAVVTVDGVKHEYKHVWLVPTMNGRYYGGGLNIAPNQNRLNSEKTVSTVIFHCKSKLKTLITFPKIFEGSHVKKTKIVEVITGHDIEVEFDRPTPLQVDGETYLNVTRYSVKAGLSSADEEVTENAVNA